MEKQLQKNNQSLILFDLKGFNLFFDEIFFESLMPLILFSFSITAEAITGPAKQPLPTSSTPAIINLKEK